MQKLENFAFRMPKHRVANFWKVIGDQPLDGVLKMLYVICDHPHCDRILHRMIERGINGTMMVESVMEDFNGNIQDYILDLLHSNPIIKGRIIL